MYFKVHYTQVNQRYVFVEARNSKQALLRTDKILEENTLGSYNDEEPIEISRAEYEEN